MKEQPSTLSRYLVVIYDIQWRISGAVTGKWRKDFFPLLRGIWDLCSRNQDFPGSDPVILGLASLPGSP